jgi:TolA-binding protein
MRARARILLASSVLLAGLLGIVFWSAHRAPAGSEQRAQSASNNGERPSNAEVLAPAPVAPKLPAPSAATGAASAPTSEAPMSESALMSELRTFKDSDPEFAIERAREGNQRFPDSADAPERSSILIHALANAGKASEARGEAEDMVNRYPDSEWVREVERFTGAHRHRNVHVDANGQLAYD